MDWSLSHNNDLFSVFGTSSWLTMTNSSNVHFFLFKVSSVKYSVLGSRLLALMDFVWAHLSLSTSVHPPAQLLNRGSYLPLRSFKPRLASYDSGHFRR